MRLGRVTHYSDPFELARFAGMDASFLTGGAGIATPAPPPTANGTIVAGGPSAHHSVIALVLFAVVILFILDRLGFRFAVTAGRR